MYASKRRQRNFKRIRETSRPGAPTNPSKRHRERLNGELETVASLLPYDEATVQRLDKLSVLRLAVSFLQIKAHFQVCAHNCAIQGVCLAHSNLFMPLPIGNIPSLVEPMSGRLCVDPMEPNYSPMALRALGGFVVILSEAGEIYYVTENIDMYLGFLQSDILHQSIFEMIHSEDREEIRRNLASLRQKQETPVHNVPSMERVMQARFRCLLDNTCGFVRVELRGKFIQIHSAIPHSYLPPSAEQGRWGFVAACTPFVPPVQIDPTVEDPILKTKHSLDLSILCLDNRLRQLLELEDVKSGGLSFYSFVHPEDVKCVAEAHASVTKNTSAGLMIYRLVSKRSGAVYYLQSSLRVFFKNGKAESIGGTHRTLSEVDGVALLDKRLSMKFKNLTFDDTLLQSPRNISSVANLTPVAMNADHVASASQVGGSKLASKEAKRSPQPGKSKKTAEARQQATTASVAVGSLAVIPTNSSATENKSHGSNHIRFDTMPSGLPSFDGLTAPFIGHGLNNFFPSVPQANLNDIANLSMVFPHHVQAADEIAWHFPPSDIKRLAYPQPDVAHAVNSMGFDYVSQAAPSWMPSSSNGYQPPPVPASALYPDSMSTYGMSANAFYPDQTFKLPQALPSAYMGFDSSTFTPLTAPLPPLVPLSHIPPAAFETPPTASTVSGFNFFSEVANTLFGQ